MTPVLLRGASVYGQRLAKGPLYVAHGQAVTFTQISGGVIPHRVMDVTTWLIHSISSNSRNSR